MNSILKKISLRTVAFVLAILYLSVSLISAQFELMTKKQEYDTVVSQRERLEMEVTETQALLDEEDESVYIERIARDRLGYANPGEKVFVDAQAE
ncbi:MAG: septum formation initiator family protein [Oscillospiraceae bacterium]|nr:septum formation initiator family protein [Oscillospiraceae bacterium]